LPLQSVPPRLREEGGREGEEEGEREGKREGWGKAGRE